MPIPSRSFTLSSDARRRQGISSIQLRHNSTNDAAQWRFRTSISRASRAKESFDHYVLALIPDPSDQMRHRHAKDDPSHQEKRGGEECDDSKGGRVRRRADG
jgi:hypothetical protein